MCGIPENHFFAEGRQFRVEARFSNCFQDDDAGLDIRGCALRLRAIGTHESMDMLLATGAFSPARSLRAIRHLTPSCNLRKEIPLNSVLREGLAAGMRRAPDSFSCLTYHQQIVLEWLTPQAEHHLVRFRLVPQVEEAPSAAARGVPDGEDIKHLWQMERRPTAVLAPNYLRCALFERLSRHETVSLTLQAQFHTPQADDSTYWFDASLEWDERVCPWRSLGTVVLDTPMNAEASDVLWFNPACIPTSIRVPRPGSITDLDDPRSLAAAQFHIASLLGWIRAWRRCPGSGGE
jgi:arachidonate 5-lipoxygenase